MSKHKKQTADFRIILTAIGKAVRFPVNRAARRQMEAEQWHNRANKGKPGNRAAYLREADNA